MATDQEIIDVLEERLAAAISSKNFTSEWYSTRFERLQDLCIEHGIGNQASCIIANGKLMSDRDSYWGQMNDLRHRMEAAEKLLIENGLFTSYMKKTRE